MNSNKNYPRLLVWGVGALSAMLALLAGFAEYKMSRLVLGGLGEAFPTKVYSAPHVFQNDEFQPFEQLLERVNRLNYVHARNKTLEPGEYFSDPPYFSIFLRGFKTPTYRQPPVLLHLKFDNNHECAIRNSNGDKVEEAALEPELICELSGPRKIRRDPTLWEEFPPILVQAVLAAEDHKYFSHHGLRLESILRALFHNLTTKGSIQGGSTITQQVAKNIFLSPRRTYQRKILESLLAVYLEIRHSKKWILTIYLNHIYMGQDDNVSIAGMKAAAQFYFDKGLDALDLSQVALLAGLIRSPYLYNPFTHPQEAQVRRNNVLNRMRELNMISEEQLAAALAQAVPQPKAFLLPSEGGVANYYVDAIKAQLIPKYGEDTLTRSGWKIFTNMDSLFQRWASEAVQGLPYQVALVAAEVKTGRVLAMMGGRNFKESQFNRAIQARRQPGSAFKPFIYGAALENGFSLMSPLRDAEQTYRDIRGQPWRPRNVDGKSHGVVSLREAMRYSYNLATVDLIHKIGPQKVVEFARRMGITSPLEPWPVLALGVYEVSLLELTMAYVPFVNEGFRFRPTLVESIEDANGTILLLDPGDRQSVLDPNVAFLMCSLLQDVVVNGTARDLKKYSFQGSVAGKTGTTNEGRDGWFIGFNHRIVAGAWIGDDQNRPIGISGAGMALPMWAKFMSRAVGMDREGFRQPLGVVSVSICTESGKLARAGCPQIKEVMALGSEPTVFCDLHAGGLKGWLKNLFRKKSP